jgi:Ribosomal protein L1
VCVFAQGENADKATAAGADIVGFEELAQEIKGGRMDFDVVIATPDAMRVGWAAWDGARPTWSDAKPESGHGDTECRRGCAKRKGRTGAL